MGWDAYSSAEQDWDNRKIKNDRIDEIFRKAVAVVQKKAQFADGYLRMGVLI